MPDRNAPLEPPLPASTQKLARQVEVRAARMKRRGNRHYRGAWRAAATIGLIGWTVVLPMLAGIALGGWIDRQWPSRFSWTLMLLAAGLGIGCINAWNRIKEEQEDR
jgi:ATP synthase protein I